MTNIKPRYILVTDWHKHHDYPTLGGLRWLIFNEKTNGFDSVVCRAGSRVLINEDAYFRWLDSNSHITDGCAS